MLCRLIRRNCGQQCGRLCGNFFQFVDCFHAGLLTGMSGSSSLKSLRIPIGMR
jgi:hypothetical protein